MAERRSTTKKVEDERRFRFRVRFERPEGTGDWDVSALENWLTERVGRPGYGLHDDDQWGKKWEGFAIHLDDHRIISDLVAYIDGMKIQRVRIETYTATVGANFADAVIAGIRDLKGMIAEKINQHHGQDVCCRETLKIKHGVYTGGIEDRLLKRIGTMTRLEERLVAARSSKEAEQQFTVTLDEYEHVALYEAAHTLWEPTKIGDALKDAPEAVRVLMDSLTMNIDYLVHEEWAEDEARHLGR